MTIKPALSPEEWKRSRHIYRTHSEIAASLVADESGRLGPRFPHALAALALRGQEFGFTWADVDALRDVAELFWDTADTHGPGSGPILTSLADRIEALLPPRENTGQP